MLKKNTDMYGQFVNINFPGNGIHTFLLKWDMARVTDVTPLQ